MKLINIFSKNGLNYSKSSNYKLFLNLIKMKNKNIVQNLLVLIAAIAPFVYAYFIWDSLPERVALHFGIDGTADSFGAKKSVGDFEGITGVDP